MSTASGGSRISISRISVYITFIKKLKFAIFVMFLAESLGGLTCSIEKSFHFPCFVAGKKMHLQKLDWLDQCTVNQMLNNQTNKNPDLFLLILSLSLKLLTSRREDHMCISTELAVKDQNSLPGQWRAEWEQFLFLMTRSDQFLDLLLFYIKKPII